MYKRLSSFFFEGFQERHKLDTSFIFLLKYELKIGLNILKLEGGEYVISDTIEKF